MRNLRVVGFLSALLFAASLIATQHSIAAVESVNPSNGWRIECSGDAESAGTITFNVLPNKGQVIAVSVNIAKGRGENEVAKDIRDAFRAQLPPDRFTAEADDGEDVLLKKKSGQPDFAIELASSTVEDVRLNLQRE
ncbi:MAG TPA: hypothetical protein VK629_03585 [Steroidobacteraceae bacterium]|nr:hypothetical protein [Steroidobacteraceae bacterium]